MNRMSLALVSAFLLAALLACGRLPPEVAAPNIAGASASDDELVFTSYRDGNAEVYRILADGTGRTRLTNDAAGDGAPRWSPDGRRIAFTRFFRPEDAYGVGIADLESGVSTKVTSYPGEGEGGPNWRPLAAIDALGVMEDDVQDLGWGETPSNPLLALLERVEDSLADGRTDAAVRQLEAFIHQVEAQRGKNLSDEAADSLVGYARALLARLGSG